MRGRPAKLSWRAAVWVCGVLGALGILGGWWLGQPTEPTAAPAPSRVEAPRVTPVAHASTQRPIPALDDLTSPTWGLGQGVVC
ncbi:MAG: hypothetical protein ACPHRO_14065, partial [Nannocystaceae bacterium]